MRIVCDLEANGLKNPDKIWVICCLDIDTGDLHVFREPTTNPQEKENFLVFSQKVTQWIGHNFLGYDYPVLRSLLGLSINPDDCVDTLIISQLVNFSRPNKHSLKAYGEEFGYHKLPFQDFSKYSKEMEVYCGRDAEVCRLVYQSYNHILDDPGWQRSIRMEHRFQCVVNALNSNGFYFNRSVCVDLLGVVRQELEVLDKEILNAFPPVLIPLKEIHPKFTKHGTLSKAQFKFVDGGDLSDFNGGPFTRCEYQVFNPSSHRQIVNVLNKAGWRPVNKTKTHIDTERELKRAQGSYVKSKELDLRIEELYTKLNNQKKTGWKVDEKNLGTLPPHAPSPLTGEAREDAERKLSSAKTLAKRILLESRRRTLTEWLSLVSQEGRIHGEFHGIGCWTHRMAHRHPNTANIPTAKKLYGAEMRSLWCAPKKRLLVGVDAEGIQLRIFAHYINDPEFTEALVNGRKELKTDPHSLNQSILGSVCHSRDAAKRFIYALVLGAGLEKLAEILGCSAEDAKQALDRLIKRYQGLAFLREKVIPRDAERGWFQGLDGRRVPIPHATVGGRKHLCMSGYLQNGEAIIMKMAAIKWAEKLCPQIFY